MLTKDYLSERIDYHGKRVQSYVLAHDRAVSENRPFDEDTNMRAAMQHAAIFNALTTILAAK